MTRETLHRLVDELPDEGVSTAARVLAARRHRSSTVNLSKDARRAAR